MFKNIKTLLLLTGFTVFVLNACVSMPNQNQKKRLNISSWNFSPNSVELVRYSKLAIKQYGTDLLNIIPKGVTYFCPTYAHLKKQSRIEFWSGLLSSLAYFESEHSSSVEYTENILDVTGKPVVSRGLLQISKESANAYDCKIKNGLDLHDDRININCGIKILNKWVGQEDKVIVGQSSGWFSKGHWLGAARYWSPFRERTKMNIIANETRSQSYCQS